MKNRTIKRFFRCAVLAVLAAACMALPVWADGTETTPGDISGAVSSIWTNLLGQTKTICNNVVFPALSVACGIGFAVAVIIAVVNYKKHHTMEVGWPIALLVGLLVSMTASSWVWILIGV